VHFIISTLEATRVNESIKVSQTFLIVPSQLWGSFTDINDYRRQTAIGVVDTYDKLVAGTLILAISLCIFYMWELRTLFWTLTATLTTNSRRYLWRATIFFCRCNILPSPVRKKYQKPSYESVNGRTKGCAVHCQFEAKQSETEATFFRFGAQNVFVSLVFASNTWSERESREQWRETKLNRKKLEAGSEPMEKSGPFWKALTK
jgi:hypothetical protein